MAAVVVQQCEKYVPKGGLCIEASAMCEGIRGLCMRSWLDLIGAEKETLAVHGMMH